MELREAQQPDSPPPADDFAHALAHQHQRVREFLSAQRSRVARIEADLAERIKRFDAEFEARQSRLQQGQAEIDAAEERIRQQQQALEAAIAQQQADRLRLEELQTQLGKRTEELNDRHETIVARQYQTDSLRKRLARDFRAQRETHRQAFDRQRADLQRHMADFGRRQADFERRQADLERQQADLDRQQADLDRVRTEFGQTQASAGDASADDLRQRLEMALSDLRDLKARNADLEKKLAARPAAPGTASPGASLSWEAKKRQILAALEAEGEPDTAQRRQERVEIQDVIRQTDEVMAEKDRELAEIRRVLEQQSSTLGGMAVGAAALGEILDQDAFIRDERENVKRMKEHWEDMLRQAEIDLSLDRAKLARDRSELDERLRAMQAAESAPSSGNAAGPQPPVRGRWLARLGIKTQE